MDQIDRILSAAPFSLDAAARDWVRTTLAGMDRATKIRRLSLLPLRRATDTLRGQRLCHDGHDAAGNGRLPDGPRRIPGEKPGRPVLRLARRAF